MRFFPLVAAALFSLVNAAKSPLKTQTKDTILANMELLTERNIVFDKQPAANNFDHWCNAFVLQGVDSSPLDYRIRNSIEICCCNILTNRLLKLTLKEMIELNNKGLLTVSVAHDVPQTSMYEPTSPCVKIVKLLEVPGFSPDLKQILEKKCSFFLPIDSFDDFDYLKFTFLNDRPIGKKEIDASKPVLKYDRSSWCVAAIKKLSTYAPDIQAAFLAKCELYTKVLDGRSEDYLKSLTITEEMVECSSSTGAWCYNLLNVGKVNLKFSNENVWGKISEKCCFNYHYELDYRTVDRIYLDLEIIENSSTLKDSDPNHWCFGIKSRHFNALKATDATNTFKITDATVIAKIEEKCTKDVFEVLDTFSLDQLKMRGENFSNLLISSSSSFDSTVNDHWCSKLRQIGLSAELYLNVENACKIDPSINVGGPFDLDTLSVEEIQGSKITPTILALSGKSFCNDNGKRAAIVDLRDLVEKKCQPLPGKLDGLSADEILIHSQFFDDSHVNSSGVYDETPSHWCHSVLKFQKFFRASFLKKLDSKCKVLSDKLAEEAKKAFAPDATVQSKILDDNDALEENSGENDDLTFPVPSSAVDSDEKNDSSTPQTGSNVDSSSQTPSAGDSKKSGSSAQSTRVALLSILIVLILAFFL